ncbi:treslin [Spea bombifrons]|uniref:treslin n=1 Tax=Spea bombifrons TaxID=233779 RepID=UPI00234ACA86|nr:treslin [Spea bombifrons]
MAPSHNVVLLVDTADCSLKDRVRLLSLKLLNFLTCRAGLGQVRWSYRFLNSQGGRCRPPRRSDLRELGPRSWDEFEEELEACWERARSSRASSTQTSRAVHTQGALMETVSDFQWDRPDICSPTKPALIKTRRGGRGMTADEPLKAESPTGNLAAWSCRNAVFLLSPCPHSAAQLSQFIAGSGDVGSQQVIEKLLPRGLQSIVSNRRVTLYWLDTLDWTELWSSCEHSGYLTMVEVMQFVGGRIVPSESLLLSSSQLFPYSSTSDASLSVPFDSVLSYVICDEPDHRLRFPQQDGIVFFITPGTNEEWECPVTLEPISMNQNQSNCLMHIKLKGVLQHWSQNQAGLLTVETWMLQNPNKDVTHNLFQQLLQALLSRGLHVVADVFTEEDLCASTGILTPVSESAAVLNVICSAKADGLEGLRVHGSLNEACEGISIDLSDILRNVLNICTADVESPSDISMPEWVTQELSQSSHWTSSFVEKWYTLCGTSGASTNLMESFRLINAASFTEDEQLKCDQEITHCLSEYYQKKSCDESGNTKQGENHKKRLPRTPVRQKMKTMPRSLQMLNAARLNVKAQKSQPDSVLLVPNEKNSQAKRRSSDKQEEKTKSLKLNGFKTEEELFSILKEEYEKTLSVEDDGLLTWARNAISNINSFLKTSNSKQTEVDAGKIRNLLKTSKAIRQSYGSNQRKETKLRECQVQVFLRLEMCVQCPVVQSNTDELEQTVEEITDMLRIISLTEDPSFLTNFLDENVLPEYIATIPKILADIYFSLGTQIPEDLALVLPADGDDSVIQEGATPAYSQPSISRVPSVAQLGTEEEQLEDLRTRSAKKRRTSTMTRHRSIAEPSQSMRQIEVPKKQMNKENLQNNPIVMVEKLKMPPSVQPQKDAEATKVRRNLFVQQNQSPTKKSNKLPRSQSVSAVEDLKHKRSKSHDGTKDHYKLLTKKVSETPVRKQTSNRLLHKQIKGRLSEATSDISIVEESPEKEIRNIDLRRSPRIKQLALTRRNSSFYASQPKSRNLERVHSFTQQHHGDDQTGNNSVSLVKTPKRLLFGEVLKVSSPPVTRQAARNLFSEAACENCQTPGKTKRRTPNKPKTVSKEFQEKDTLPRKSPHTPKTPVRTPKLLKTPSKTSTERTKAAKNLGKLFSPSKMLLKSSSRSCSNYEITPPRESSQANFASPLKNTEVTALHVRQRLSSPSNRANQMPQVSRTPSKSPYRVNEPLAQCTTPSRYALRTPQKPLAVPVCQTPTPKKCVERGLPTAAPCVLECTPQKRKPFSPAKLSTFNCSLSPNGMPKSIVGNSPFKASAMGNNSMLLYQQMHRTPPKLSSPLTPLAKSNDRHSSITSDGNPKTLCNVSAHIQGETSSQTQRFILPSGMPSSEMLSPGLKNTLSTVCSPKCKGEPIVLCEKLDMSSLDSTENSGSFVTSSQTEESIDITDAVVVPTETSELKMKVLFTRKPSDCNLMSNLPSTPKCASNALSSSPYGLRRTPDRRQREAAARLGTPQIPSKFSTPKSHQPIVPVAVPTYEVELEMQASGLPKLRFRRTDSSSTVDLDTANRSDSPHPSKKRKGDESPFSESWCSKHAMKLESTCISPSCILSSHATPGKGSVQTFICQSYTPNRCSSNAASPAPLDVGVPWTPSPKFKDKNGSDAINNWPRRKKASTVNSVLKLDKNLEHADPFHSPVEDPETVVSEQVTTKPPSPGDFELEGVSKLEEHSPVIVWQGNSDLETYRLKSRKRGLEFLSPNNSDQCSKKPRTAHEEYDLVHHKNEDLEGTDKCHSSQSVSSNLNSSQRSSCDEVFNISGFTPPNNLLKSSISASGLLSLTQSPMLYQGKTPLSKRKMTLDGEPEAQQGTPQQKRQALQPSDSEDSPFSKAVSFRSVSRTYSRKKLIP